MNNQKSFKQKPFFYSIILIFTFSTIQGQASHTNRNNKCCNTLKRTNWKILYEPNNEYITFCRWLKQYVAPTICPVYLCHGNCAMGSNPCPSFNNKIKFYRTENGNVSIESQCCSTIVNDNDILDLTNK